MTIEQDQKRYDYHNETIGDFSLEERRIEMNKEPITTELTYGETWDVANRPRQPELMDHPIEQRIAVASKIATQLKKVIDEQGLSQRIGKGEHVRVEGWQAAGVCCGLTSREVESHRDDLGWHTKVEVIDSAGRVVGKSSAICGHTEKMWADREEYARKSMSATRATSKAFRSVIAWVVSMAGYDTTPAEEMPHEQVKKPGATRRKASPAPPATKKPSPPQSTTPDPFADSDPSLAAIGPDAGLMLEDIQGAVNRADLPGLLSLADSIKKYANDLSSHELATLRESWKAGKALLESALS